MHGKPGHNIPADLHNEHLNRLCKNTIRHLGSNKSAEGVIRASKALGTLDPCLRQFDKDNDISPPSGRHSHASAEKDRDTIINELMKYNALEIHDERHMLPGLPNPTSLLHKCTKADLREWICSHADNYFI